MRENGYTLTEIIVCLVLIALIALIAIVKIDNKEQEENKAKQEFETAANAYISKIKTNQQYKAYYKSDVGYISCLSPNSIIDNGYIKETNEYYKELKENNKYLKVETDNLGFTTYEEIEKSKLENVCTTYDIDIKLTDTSPIIIGDTEETGYKIEIPEIKKNDNLLNVFDLNVSVDLNNQIPKDLKYNVIVVFDGSTSMNGEVNGVSRIVSAKNAIKDLMNSINSNYKSNENGTDDLNDDQFAVISDIDEITSDKQYIAIVEFGNLNTTTLKKYEDIVSDDYVGTHGNTCYSCGLQKAEEIITSAESKNNKYKTIMVFLTDGINNRGNCYTNDYYAFDKCSNINKDKLTSDQITKYNTYQFFLKNVVYNLDKKNLSVAYSSSHYTRAYIANILAQFEVEYFMSKLKERENNFSSIIIAYSIPGTNSINFTSGISIEEYSKIVSEYFKKYESEIKDKNYINGELEDGFLVNYEKSLEALKTRENLMYSATPDNIQEIFKNLSTDFIKINRESLIDSVEIIPNIPIEGENYTDYNFIAKNQIHNTNCNTIDDDGQCLKDEKVTIVYTGKCLSEECNNIEVPILGKESNSEAISIKLDSDELSINEIITNDKLPKAIISSKKVSVVN